MQESGKFSHIFFLVVVELKKVFFQQKLGLFNTSY